ncbi:LPS O-antigen length regulator [Endozoicomonas sp. G2_1]|uniref:Wzz/FepE/Etk N-terminal domain-containing protein n=1 Tax=Endozoicomonas sp. G2_1 TaxID=2821091 RepID=UPI001ADA6AFB|nr:Wzz/FepE/Etk N-terminal domain-containing protein [Endozoicomonas sp. G2_1]MBO9488997.1 LPS O-antigen length regulator [Endozoicomonas sp. G2_1]
MESKDLQRLQELETLLRLNQFSRSNTSNDEIDLKELVNAILQGKWTIIVVSILFTIASIAYALSQPNVYKASVLLAPASSENGAAGLSKLAGQFGGLASLAGINLGGGNTDKTSLALEVLKSRKFIEEFISENDLAVSLIAVESWDRVNDKPLYNDELYDIDAKIWTRDVSFPKTIIPSSWETYEAFSEILSISQDKDTGMVTITVSYYSPKVAKQWLTLLVKQLNEKMRLQDSREAQNSIDFLTAKLEQTQLAEMQNVFYQLIEEQMKTIMLAEVSNEYVLKTIDPANVPDKNDKPNRVLIVILGLVFGGVFSVLTVLIRYFSGKSSANSEDA